MKKAYFSASKELIEQLLLLPEGVKVTAMSFDHGTDSFVFSIQGDGLPDQCLTREGNAILKLTPWYTNWDYKSEFCGWDGIST